MKKDQSTDQYLFRFQFVLDDEADQEAVAALVRRRLAELGDVEKIQVLPGRTRAVDPVLIVQSLGAAVVVLKGTTEAVEALRKLIKAVRELGAEIKQIRGTRIEVGDTVRRADELDDADLLKAVEAARD